VAAMNRIVITGNVHGLRNSLSGQPAGVHMELVPPINSQLQSSNSRREISLTATLWIDEGKCVSPVQQGYFLIRNDVLLVWHDFPWMRTHGISLCFPLAHLLLSYS